MPWVGNTGVKLHDPDMVTAEVTVCDCSALPTLPRWQRGGCVSLCPPSWRAIVRAKPQPNCLGWDSFKEPLLCRGSLRRQAVSVLSAVWSDDGPGYGSNMQHFCTWNQVSSFSNHTNRHTHAGTHTHTHTHKPQRLVKSWGVTLHWVTLDTFAEAARMLECMNSCRRT